jgi:hypothetical protein
VSSAYHHVKWKHILQDEIWKMRVKI